MRKIPPGDWGLAGMGCEEAASLAPPLLLPSASCQAERRPRGEGSWAKGMAGFQLGLIQPLGLEGELLGMGTLI